MTSPLQTGSGKVSACAGRCRPQSDSLSINHHRQVAFWALHGWVSDGLNGVLDYIAQKQQRWSLIQLWEIPVAAWPSWRGDGIIAVRDLNALPVRAEQMQVPFVNVYPSVNVGSGENNLPLFWIDHDHVAIGEMAAEHLIERGVNQFGFRGTSSAQYSEQRRDGFVRRLQQAGYPCAIYSDPDLPDSDPQVEAVARWLAGLPKPVGIFCDVYYFGQEVLSACHRLGLAIPEEVAIITEKESNNHGHDPLTQPSLSYIRLNTRRVGYEAASMLDRLMAGEPVVPGTGIRVAPLGVEARQSTDVLAISDPRVATALRYIWQHACEGIQTKDVLHKLPQSRWSLEHNFQKFVGRTPHEEITRIRMNRAKALLSETNLPLKQIAERTGFAHVENFVGKFRHITGISPGKYRALNAETHEH